MITFSLLVLLIPVLFFMTHTLMSEIKKVSARERLQMEYMAFHTFIHREIRQGIRFTVQGGTLTFSLATEEEVCYQQKKRQLIRSVRKPGEKQFVGHTVLLQNVYYSTWVPDDAGVQVEVGLQNWSATLEMSTYIQGGMGDEAG